MKKIIVSGITGQDGSYLAEQLLAKGHVVHGIRRRVSTRNLERLENLNIDPQTEKNFFLHYGDLNDSGNLTRIIKEVEPDEIYHLGAQSHVKISYDIPEYTANVDAIGTLRLLQAVKFLGLEDKTKIYNASTSELYGLVQESPQTEKTPFYPRSPYAVAKLYSYWICINYREAYNMFVSNGILFNHESPRRGHNFVTKKITESVVNIINGKQDKIYLGNINAKRDWGFAPDYTDAMQLILQHNKPDDFVIATGENHTVKEFVEKAFNHVDINIEWRGKNLKEKGIDTRTNKSLVEIDPYYFRPAEVETLCGDATKAKKELGWEPKTKFDELVKIMMEAELCLQN